MLRYWGEQFIWDVAIVSWLQLRYQSSQTPQKETGLKGIEKVKQCTNYFQSIWHSLHLSSCLLLPLPAPVGQAAGHSNQKEAKIAWFNAG